MKNFVLIIMVVLFFPGLVLSAQQKQLLTKLLKDYNVLERPVNKSSDVVSVQVGLTVLSILNVDMKSSTLETYLWLNLAWADKNLVWNPSEYDNITDIKLPIQRVWKPDIHAYNSQHDLFDTTYETMVVVQHNGSVLHVPPGLHKTSCVMDFTYYPLDEQKCNIKMGSWTHHGLHIDLTVRDDQADTSSFVPNNDWNLKSVPAKRSAIYYSCCPEPYIDVTYTLHIQRKGETILHISKVINAFICVMILMSFVVSPASGQKLIIGFGTLICNIWLISSNNVVIPANHDSLLTLYFHRLCSLVFSSLVANVFTIFLYYQKWAMPQLIKRIFLEKIPSVLHWICPTRKNTSASSTEMEGSFSFTRQGNLLDEDFQGSDPNNLVQKVLRQGECNMFMRDWNYLACIVDRFFLVIYAICILIFVTLLFPSFNLDE